MIYYRIKDIELIKNEKTVGSNGHPGYEAHKIAAEILVDYLKEHI